MKVSIWLLLSIVGWHPLGAVAGMLLLSVLSFWDDNMTAKPDCACGESVHVQRSCAGVTFYHKLRKTLRLDVFELMCSTRASDSEVFI